MSVTLSEYYNTGENSTQADNIVAKQITGKGPGTVLHFADDESIAITDWTWWAQKNPQVGDYFGLQGVVEDSPKIIVTATQMDSDFSPETEAHGGHEPIIFILD